MDGMISESKQTYKCKYCGKEFKRETSFAVHMCEPKKRWQDKDTPASRIAFKNFINFYEMTQGSAKTKTFEDFVTSAYYKAFFKFGTYCVNARVINAERFAEWLLKQNKRIDYWGSDKLYDEWLKDYIFREPGGDAMTRALETGIAYAMETNTPSEHFLRHGNANKICHLITTGRVTGWTIFCCDSGHEFLQSLNQEQVQIIYDFINPDRWQQILKDYPGDTEYNKEMLSKAGW